MNEFCDPCNYFHRYLSSSHFEIHLTYFCCCYCILTLHLKYFHDHISMLPRRALFTLLLTVLTKRLGELRILQCCLYFLL